jgi:hypothetical protein
MRKPKPDRSNAFSGTTTLAFAKLSRAKRERRPWMGQRMIGVGDVLGRKWVGGRRALYSARVGM